MARTRILIGDNLLLSRIAGAARFVCSCGRDLGDGEVNFKKHCRVRESPAAAIGPGYASPDEEMAARMCFREFFCPDCGTRLATEVARVGDPYLWDIQPRL